MAAKTLSSINIRVVPWADTMSGHYTPSAIDEFLRADEADAWLGAYALANADHIVIVTHEIS